MHHQKVVLYLIKSALKPVLSVNTLFLFPSQACGFVKFANPGKRERSFYMKRQHKSNGATMHHWDGLRTGTTHLLEHQTAIGMSLQFFFFHYQFVGFSL